MTVRFPFLAFMAIGMCAPVEAAVPNASGFVRSIYLDLPTLDADEINWAPSLAKLIERDVTYAGVGAVGALDWMPLCVCQDLANDYRLTGTRILAATKNSAKVQVVVHNIGRQTIVVDVVRIGGQWAIADIHHKKVPSLLAFLEREVPKEEAVRAVRTD